MTVATRYSKTHAVVDLFAIEDTYDWVQTETQK